MSCQELNVGLSPASRPATSLELSARPAGALTMSGRPAIASFCRTFSFIAPDLDQLFTFAGGAITTFAGDNVYLFA